MESFFLAETTKYLYLLFDPDNFLNNDGGHGIVIDTPNGQCIIEAGGYIFNTEAHPIDPSALRCCYDMPRESLLADYNSDTFLGTLFEFSSPPAEYDESSNLYHLNVTTTVEIQTRVDTESTRQNIVSEILNVLKEKKKKDRSEIVLEEKQPPAIDDSIVLPVDRKEQPIKSGTVDAVNSSSDVKNSDNLNVVSPPINESQAASDFMSSSNDRLHPRVGNSSIISDFVQSILKTAQPAKAKFDPQAFLEKIRANGIYNNRTQNFELLSCKAQPFLQRLTVQGEFFWISLIKIK